MKLTATPGISPQPCDTGGRGNIAQVNDQKSEMVHIGELIKSELNQQGRSASWLAKQLCCDRSNIYSIFKRQSIDTMMLMRISRVLNHNFFDVYCNDYKKSSATSDEN